MLTILTIQKGEGQLKTTIETIGLNYSEYYCCVFKKKGEKKASEKERLK